ncbi:MAG: esterase [Legionella sp.]|nr:MAG: esterase [Legionella sp.]
MKQQDEVARSGIKRVVCSGGGAKAVVYPGAYKAMVDAGVFKDVQTLAGASAGAITASLLAVGMPPAILRAQLLQTDFESLLGESVKIKGPGISFLTKDGLPLEQFLRDNILNTIRQGLANLKSEDLQFKEFLDKIATQNPCITFADLAMLHRLFPTAFKQLIVSAVQFPHGELQVFNSQLTPDVEIALACRASASIPVLLKPVEIQINKQVLSFVDGGLYDNLPTDFFDQDEWGGFTKNKEARNTLVFAFGEGLANQQNQVFQALYGERWEEAISKALLKRIIEDTFGLIDPDEQLHSEEAEAGRLIQAMRWVLKNYLKQKKLTPSETKEIGEAMEKAIRALLLDPENHQQFWKVYQKVYRTKRLNLLASFIKEQMKPILYQASCFEKFKRNILVEFLGDLQLPFKNTDQKELGYQKLRKEYALRTVELRVGEIKTTDFATANKVARVMDAFGYLDTMNHLINHDLHNPMVFKDEEFYVDLMTYFIPIYEAVLVGSGQNPQHDSLLQEIKTHKISGARAMYYLIKDAAERDLHSIAAFALSRALEFKQKIISAEELFKESYTESFGQSGFFALSKITGETIFIRSTLQAQLKQQNMFALYHHKPHNDENRRTEKIFCALKKLPAFSDAYREAIVHSVSA